MYTENYSLQLKLLCLIDKTSYSYECSDMGKLSDWLKSDWEQSFDSNETRGRMGVSFLSEFCFESVFS